MTAHGDAGGTGPSRAAEVGESEGARGLLPVGSLGPLRVRVFSSSRSAPSSRRASDVVVLVPSALALAALVAAYPPSSLERSLGAFLDSVPGWLGPVWDFAYVGLSCGALALLVAALAARRPGVVGHAAAAVAIAGLVAAASTRVATGAWPDGDELLRLRADPAGFAVVRVAIATAVGLAIAPHLVRPLQRAARWIVGLGAIGALFVEPVAAGAVLAAVVIGIVAAAATRLALGTSAGIPEAANVREALTELGVDVETLDPADRRPAGSFVARARDAAGRTLTVKVYGRDAYDTQVVDKLWRTLWYRDGPELRLTRGQAVEHEALVTLMARRAGAAAGDVLVAGEASSGDAVLVLVQDGRSFDELDATRLDERLLRAAWAAVARLHAVRIAHGRLDASTLVVAPDGRVGLADFAHGTLVPRPDHLATDRARLLAATAALVGPERAVAAALAGLGAERLAETLPYVQPAAVAGPLGRSLDEAGIDVDELRQAAATAAGVEPPQPVRLRRVTTWTVVQAALLVLAATTVIGALTGLDLDELRDDLDHASWGWLAVGLVLAQLPRVTQAVSTLGSVAARLPFGPVYAMQLTTAYMNLALPSNLARMAISIRFFQRQGVPPAAAVTSGVIDSFASTVVQAVLLGLLLIFSASSLSLGLEVPVDSLSLVVLLAVVVAAAALVAALVRPVRDAVVGRARRWWPDVREALSGLRAAHKLALLIGGTLATEILFAVAVGVFANAFGHDIGLADLLVINISVSLLASFVPIPGGIGVAELGLTVGLVGAGMPEETALLTALLYRVATFYLPPVWGFFAMRWLQRNAYL